MPSTLVVADGGCLLLGLRQWRGRKQQSARKHSSNAARHGFLPSRGSRKVGFVPDDSSHARLIAGVLASTRRVRDIPFQGCG